MKKKWVGSVLCILAIFLVAYFSFRKSSQRTASRTVEHLKESHSEYFVPIHLAKFTDTNLPCIPVEIENKSFTMEIDLGFRGDVSIDASSIDLISEKKFIGTKKMYGFRGDEREDKLYLLPRITIGTINVYDTILQESSEDFRRQASIVQEGAKPPRWEVGRVGWELFHNGNLFLDIKNSRIAFCDSIDTLGLQGYSIDAFVKVPLLIERGLVEFQADTPKGLLRCALDTGCTWNFFHSEIETGKAIEEAAWDPENQFKFNSFQIGDREFGEIRFHRLPIHLPIQVDAMLGMEFFEDHLVFIDFSEKCIYFAKSSPQSSDQ